MAQKKKRRKAPVYLVVLVVFGFVCTAGLAVVFYAHLNSMHDTPTVKAQSSGPTLGPIIECADGTPPPCP